MTIFYTNKNQVVFGEEYEKLTDRSVRKSIGMFYTPDFIIDYILNNTISDLDVVKNPFIKILDPCCGAGYFLIRVYDLLKEKFQKNIFLLREKYSESIYNVEGDNLPYYEELKSSNAIKGRYYWVEENIHYHIIKNCLFGADLDRDAVNLAKKNLLGKSNTKVNCNIVQCDSLIKWEEVNSKVAREKIKGIIGKGIIKEDFHFSGSEFYNDNYNDEYIDKLRVFWSNDFDYILGNPPYVVMLQSEAKENYWNYILDNYKTLGYKKNVFYLIIERTLHNLKNGGRQSFIIPDRYFFAESYLKSRKYLMDNTRLLNIANFSDRVFDEAIVDTAIYVAEKGNPSDNHIVNLKMDYINESSHCRIPIYQKSIKENNIFPANMVTKYIYRSIIDKINKKSKKLGDFSYIHVGMMIKNKHNHFEEAAEEKERNPIVIGRDLDTYVIGYRKRYCCLDKIEIFGGTKNIEKHKRSPKILLRKTGNHIVASLDDIGVFSEQSVYLILPYKEKNVYSLLGEIQSGLCNFYFKQCLITNPKAYPYIQHYDLKRLPINESLLKDSRYEDVIRTIIYLKNKLNTIDMNWLKRCDGSEKILEKYDKMKYEKNSIISEINNYINKSNYMLYKSYGLTEEEIKVIEDDEYSYKHLHCVMTKGEESYYISLIEEISYILKEEIKTIFKEKKKFLSLKEIEDILKNNLKNFNELIYLLINYSGKKSTEESVIKNILMSNCEVWNNYKKKKLAKKKVKDFVKYSRNEYGLAMWSEEVHYNYFLHNNRVP